MRAPNKDSAPPAPQEIQLTRAYTVGEANRLLGLRKNCIPREIKLGRLRVSRRANRYYILGEWLLEWLRDGEVKRNPASTAG